MKTTFDSNCLLSAGHLRAAALDKLVKPQRELCELMDAFAILDIWQSLFHSSHGQLQSLVHCSNPDDPPDAIAKFARGDLGIEHTIIEPSHRVHGTKLIQQQFPGKGFSAPPLSGSYDRVELQRLISTPSDPAFWESVGNHMSARSSILSSAAAKKFGKYPECGLLVLRGSIGEFEQTLGDEVRAIKEGMLSIQNLPAFERWILAVYNTWGDSTFFSAIYSPAIGFRCLRKDWFKESYPVNI
jgi:hypothetical protein